MKKTNIFLVALLFLVGGTAAFAANGWISVNDSCGGTFYINSNNFSNVDQMNKFVMYVDDLRCP